MALRYGGRKLSFDVLNGDYGSTDDEETFLIRSISDSFGQNTRTEINSGSSKASRRKRKTKSSKKKKVIEETLVEEPITEKRVDAVFDDHSNHSNTVTATNDDNRSISYENGSCELDYQSYNIQTVICEEIRIPEKENVSVRTVHRVAEKDYEILNGERRRPFVEVRRRSRPPSGTIDESIVMSVAKEGSIAKEANSGEQLRSEVNGNFVQLRSEVNGNFGGNKLEKAESLDWNHLMTTKDSDFSSTEKSPVKYFMGEVYRGHSLQGTTTLGNEKERERVYDTIFRLPWRCELIIDVGFFVCLDSFLSLLTIMPARILTTLWRCINTRQFRRPSAEDLSDFGCLIVLACGVALLQQADISLIYHMIRGQGTIKLYVVYNVLEIFDRLCQNFGGDVFQTLFSSAKGLANSSPDNMNFWLWRFISDQALTIVASIAHSFVLLAQAITLSTCIVSHNNALMALLVSNNFAEIKSNVFKRFSKDNVHSLVYFDSIERFHISAFILFVLAQNILEAEGPWFGSFLSNALVVYFCEMFIDIIKHSFIAKFNEIKPTAYSEFLEDLCKQTLNMQAEDEKKNLTFVPLAPACVVIRVLTPVYAAHLPYGPLPWRLLWILLLSAMTYVMLVSLKVMVGMGLHKHATWYVNRCQRRKLHSD